eukprot:Colp12_sorted_trinity150504_noHs@4066
MANTIALLLCLAVLWVGIEAHGSLSYPITRDKVNGVRLDLQDAPVSGYTGKDFVCRNQPAGSPVITLVAGQTFPMRWDFGAAHVGDCAVYVSYDVNVADDQQKKFYKIANLYDCKSQNRQYVAVMLPSILPNCDNCILRWEWYGIHQGPASPEFYAQCVDIKITGSTAAAGSLPSSQAVTIGTHILPGSATNYRNPFDNANGAGNNFITGPAILNVNGNTYGATGTNVPVKPVSGIITSYGSNPTSAASVYQNQAAATQGVTTNNNPQPATTSTTNQNTQTPSGTGTQTQSSSPSAYVCESYKVQTGDTLSIIAANYSVTLNEILKDNPQITNANLIFVGDVISICRGSKMNFAGQLQVDVFLIIMALVCALMAYAI